MDIKNASAVLAFFAADEEERACETGMMPAGDARGMLMLIFGAKDLLR